LTIAQALGVGQTGGRQDAPETLIQLLRDRRAILVIDNFETVVGAGLHLGRILADCPSLTMLVTSRIALQVSGEHRVLVPPLDLPEASRLPLETLKHIESVSLFIERAKASASGFKLTEDNASAIVDICRRLDGLPLALELAAARIGMLSPTALRGLLQTQRGILSDGPRDAPERHRSMRNAIAWSYDMLPEHEQAVFRSMAVFGGSFSLEAAEALVDHPWDMLDTLTSLAAKSLIVPVPSDDPEPRFTLLETLREYGLERLEEHVEATMTRDRHAAFYLE
jgi:predicted ATPase